ncbi:hypothetical protein O6H91_22G044200 [Diphasiastrum complanatum]|uniref:Uncharacterized protein n=1 Tax=Diphasiastrum complanatum TaxID=34168 RepID=A0ACC2AEW0_DIPCM|nr:hypothetical protein O6H91_22G044200 [Diphasiastrum complanatum]
MLPEHIVRSISFVRAMCSLSSWFTGQVGDGRENALLEHVRQTSAKGDPQSVLQAADAYSQRTWFMNVGNEKGALVDAAVRDRNPKVALELGTYCGYSAVRISSQFQQPESLLISIEKSPPNAEIAKQIIDHAGLSSKCEVLQGTLTKRVQDVKDILKKFDQQFIDFVFLDHAKEFYLSDYLLLKNEHLIGPGTVIVADNMGFPGSPKFWKYLKNAEELETVSHKCTLEYISWVRDTVAVSTYKSGF